MSPETQQKILKAFERILADLDEWLKGLGLSESEIVPIYAAILKENGIAARLLMNQTAAVFPLSSDGEFKPQSAVDALGRLRSGEYAEWLLTQPEPEPEALAAMLNAMKSALPNLRSHFSESAKVGPRHKRGGRPQELPDQRIREEIQRKIKDLRDPDTTLKDIYGRLARQYGVSPLTIKRIREQKTSKSE